jgi:hypothetical protein
VTLHSVGLSSRHYCDVCCACAAKTIEPRPLSYALLCGVCKLPREIKMSDELIGLRVQLDCADRCCDNLCIVRASANDAYELCCAACGSRRGPLHERAAGYLRGVVRIFGTPSSPILINRAVGQKGPTEMKRDDLFPSRYFKASDLGGTSLDLAIKSATVETLKDMQGGAADKLVLAFVGQKKALVVNRTNYDALAEVFGEETEDWPGKRITLFPDTTRVGGKSIACVRVRAVNSADA